MFERLFIKISIAVFLLAMGFFGIKIYIASQIEKQTQQKMSAFVLSMQNQAIQKRALDSKNYLEQSQKSNQTILTKYKTIIKKDMGCDEELKGIKNALDIYFDTPNIPK